MAYWGAVAAFACAVLSYPIVLGGAAVLLVLDVYPLRRFTDGYASATARKIYLEKLPFVLLATGGRAVTAHELYTSVARILEQVRVP